jgi:hypothetical protein
VKATITLPTPLSSSFMVGSNESTTYFLVWFNWIAQVVETERGSCALVSSATSADEHTKWRSVTLFWRPRQKSLGNHASHDLHEVHNEVPFFFLYSTMSMAYYWQYGCSINNDKTTAWQ